MIQPALHQKPSKTTAPGAAEQIDMHVGGVIHDHRIWSRHGVVHHGVTALIGIPSPGVARGLRIAVTQGGPPRLFQAPFEGARVTGAHCEANQPRVVVGDQTSTQRWVT